MSVERVIWNKFKIQRGWDSLPLIGTGSRDLLPELFQELGYKYGAEVGVRKAEYSEIICKAMPGVKLVCIDPWSAYRGADGTKAGPDRQEKYYQYCQKKLSAYDVKFLRMTSEEALKEVPDNSLDFVYIDAIHDFDSVAMDIISWTKKVKAGGIISGHDYYHYHHFGVIEFVDAYTRAHNIQQWYVTGEGDPSWFWQKK